MRVGSQVQALPRPVMESKGSGEERLSCLQGTDARSLHDRGHEACAGFCLTLTVRWPRGLQSCNLGSE